MERIDYTALTVDQVRKLTNVQLTTLLTDDNPVPDDILEEAGNEMDRRREGKGKGMKLATHPLIEEVDESP